MNKGALSMKGDEIIARCPEQGKILLRNIGEKTLRTNLSVRCPSCSSHFHRAHELVVEHP